jgi:hypothetical protein
MVVGDIANDSIVQSLERTIEELSKQVMGMQLMSGKAVSSEWSVASSPARRSSSQATDPLDQSTLSTGLLDDEAPIVVSARALQVFSCIAQEYILSIELYV